MDNGVCCDLKRGSLESFLRQIFRSTYNDISNNSHRSYLHSIPCSLEERKVSTYAFLVTWLPFQILNLVASQCSSCEISLVVVIVTKLLHYANSIINIVIYPVRNREYRAALFQMLSSVYNYFRRSRRIAQSSENNENCIVFVVRKSNDTQLNFDHFHENTRL